MPGRATMTMSHRECPTARASNNTTTIPPDACADDDHGSLSTPADKLTGVSGNLRRHASGGLAPFIN